MGWIRSTQRVKFPQYSSTGADETAQLASIQLSQLFRMSSQTFCRAVADIFTALSMTLISQRGIWMIRI